MASFVMWGKQIAVVCLLMLRLDRSAGEMKPAELLVVRMG